MIGAGLSRAIGDAIDALTWASSEDAARANADGVRALGIILAALGNAYPMPRTHQLGFGISLADMAKLCEIGLDLEALIEAGIDGTADHSECVDSLRERLTALIEDRPVASSIADATAPAGRA